MAKKQQEHAQGTSPFVSWEQVGQQVQGKFLSFQPTKLGMAVQLDTALIGLGATLRGLFSQVHETIKPGDLIRVVYRGEGTKKVKGNYPKLFDLYFKGKKIQNSFAPATKEQIAEFFAPPDPGNETKGKRGKK